MSRVSRTSIQWGQVPSGYLWHSLLWRARFSTPDTAFFSLHAADRHAAGSEEHAAFSTSKRRSSPPPWPPQRVRVCPVTIDQPSTSTPSIRSISNELTPTLSFPRRDAGFYLCGYFLFWGSFPFYFCYTEKSQHLVSQSKQIRLP